MSMLIVGFVMVSSALLAWDGPKLQTVRVQASRSR